MAQYKTPNVYMREESVLPTSAAEVATSIPAFIGYTQITTDKKDETKSIINKPYRITTLAEYEEIFGDLYYESLLVENKVSTVVGEPDEYFISDANSNALPSFFLYQSIQHYFANGGGACWVVSCGGYETSTTATDGSVTFTPTVIEKGDLEDGLAAIAQIDEVTLFVIPEAVTLTAVEHYGIHTTALQQASDLKDRFALIDVQQGSLLEPNQAGDALAMRSNVVGDLKYGASYYPYLRTAIARSYDESTTMVNDGAGNLVSLASLKASNTATYNSVKGVLRSNYLILPPCAAVAGCIASVDGSRGVWKAPANVALKQVLEPMIKIDDSQQEPLNVDATAGKSINAIRAFTGKGNLIWGARTLAGNDLEWRYINVRRLFNMVEETLMKATAFAVFEPNTPITWLKLKSMTENYLRSLWQQGALTGASESEAFFVNVGLGESMTQQDILEGLMKIKIGISPSRPAEFIELTFQHKSQDG
ncbi:phage tail sheath family protein [Marinomonas balearica]|uniref:Tail sheath protein C-terminal domain-containing protein n=1 Tax=Marinomonas balearica TaxID=491947 RepID=A0A4V3CG83_9GAMM|nr:phage tail sheath C-terminal domain-containing protein [Marinomonas balearica]TDO96692.1 hypothetical protein DFP79_2455 [Marinomonas balearica]